VTGFPKNVRELVFIRANGYCEICGFDQPTQIHHRRARGAGGTRRVSTNTASNALAVSLECHALAESRRELAYSRGWLVHQQHNPAEVPVMINGSEWVLLDDHGYTTAVEQ
jgi:hypothetical protein